MSERILLDPAEWFESLPTAHLSASALITDRDGRLLIVKPNYRDHWVLPGGVVEQGESPHDGAAREVAEELGLDLSLGRLLLIDWAPPQGARARSFLNFLFDGGTFDDPGAIVLQEEELDEFKFVPPEETRDYLAHFIARRIGPAIAARANDETIYLPGDERADRK